MKQLRCLCLVLGAAFVMSGVNLLRAEGECQQEGPQPGGQTICDDCFKRPDPDMPGFWNGSYRCVEGENGHFVTDETCVASTVHFSRCDCNAGACNGVEWTHGEVNEHCGTVGEITMDPCPTVPPDCNTHSDGTSPCPL
jgi:hypothetical protein